MEEYGLIEIKNTFCYLQKDWDIKYFVEKIEFQTEFDALYLNINNDNDELFWSKTFENKDDYMLSEIQLELSNSLIVNYWRMINQKGHDDAIQFEIKSTPKNHFIQIVAIASSMDILQFN